MTRRFAIPAVAFAAWLGPTPAHAEDRWDDPSLPAPVTPRPPSLDSSDLGPTAPPPAHVPMVTIDNSRRMIIGGIVLVSVGSTVAGLGVAGMVASSHDASDMAAIGQVGSLLAVVAGGVGVLTGIPLWIAGEYDITVPATHKKAVDQLGPYVPDRVSLGPGELTATWSF